MGGCKRHPADSPLLGLLLSLGRAGVPPGRPKTGSSAGAQRLITQGLHGHIKQMTVITELLPLQERETTAPSGRGTDHGPERSLFIASPRQKLRQARPGQGMGPGPAAGLEAESPVFQPHKATSFSEREEKWVCFLGFYRVTEGRPLCQLKVALCQ